VVVAVPVVAVVVAAPIERLKKIVGIEAAATATAAAVAETAAPARLLHAD